jgi:hypothetical protein
MNFTILSPSGDGPRGDTPLQTSQSDMIDGRFGGLREHSNVADAKDYTKRTGEAPDKKENPVDETTRDIDDMSNTAEKKREFSYQENKMDVQKNNEGIAIQSDPDNLPRMNEGTDAVQVPEVVEERVRRKANRWQFDTSNTYEGEMS